MLIIKLFSIVMAITIMSENRMQGKRFIWTIFNHVFSALSKYISEEVRKNIDIWIKDFILDILPV